MTTLKGKTLFITGASRGIGLAIALRAARDGANIVIVAKTTEPHPALPGTIFSAADAVMEAGGHALPCAVDVRDAPQVTWAAERAAEEFGGIDILVNNAGALSLTNTEETSVSRFDRLHEVNVRGAFVATKACLPWLKKASNPHILNIAPPLNLEPRWLAPHLPYSLSKFGMSLSVMGLAEEFKEQGIAVNALWPATTIATAAVKNLLGGDPMIARSRKPDIMADAAHVVLTQVSRECTGNFFIDEVLLDAQALDIYSVTPGGDLQPDLFV